MKLLIHIKYLPFAFFRRLRSLIVFPMSIVLLISCNKLVQVSAPKNSITTEEVFSDSADAAAAISGIYSNLIYGGTGGVSFGSGSFSIFCGLSADELLPFFSGGGSYFQFSSNKLLYNNGNIYSFWSQGYTYLYQANAAIEGLQASKTIDQSTKDRLIGEAKWIRAFINFYLVNVFGDIPLVTSTSYLTNQVKSRTSTAQVYQSIVDDLKAAQSSLPVDYSSSGGEKIRANKWAATALLARVYLYLGDFGNAEAQASTIINSGVFSLDKDLNNVFLANSTEAILQFGIVTNLNVSTGNLLPEGYVLIPYPAQPAPYYVTPELLSAFENGDLRYSAWLDSTSYNGTTYYYPYKYKNGILQYDPTAQATEYYMVMRLAEQYLIRAEAEANGATGGDAAAVADLNIIRGRAQLTPLSTALNHDSVVVAVAHERQIELFSEWGHRWFDLKRTNQANSVLGSISYKQPWKPNQLLYPIPYSELQGDPNLIQNPGY